MAGLKGWITDFLKDGLKDYLLDQLKAAPGRALWTGMVGGALWAWEPVRSWATEQVTAPQWVFAIPYAVAFVLFVGGMVGSIQAHRKLRGRPTAEALKEVTERLDVTEKKLSVSEFLRSVNEHDISDLKAHNAELQKTLDEAKLTAPETVGALQAAVVRTKELTTALEAEKARAAGALHQAHQQMGALHAEVAELKAEISRMKKRENAAVQDQPTLAGKVLKKMDQASLSKTDRVPPIVDKDYKEVSLDGIHWRWSYLPPYNQVTNVKAYCDHCDYDLDVNAIEDRGRGPCVSCPKCGTLAKMDSRFGSKTVEKATAEIERRIRNNLWMKDLPANKARADDILNDAARHSPVVKRITLRDTFQS